MQVNTRLCFKNPKILFINVGENRKKLTVNLTRKKSTAVMMGSRAAQADNIHNSC